MCLRFFWNKEDQSVYCNEAVSYYMVKGKTRMAIPEKERFISIWAEKIENDMGKCSIIISVIN